MLIILEGPDGAGKTHFADELRIHIKRHIYSDAITMMHAGPPKAHPLDEYLRPLTGYRPGTGQHIIIDRWHWGELVYPTVRNRVTDMTAEVRWSIESYLRRLGAVMVLCRQPRAEYDRVFAEPNRVADRWQLEELDQTEKLFDAVQMTTSLACVTRDLGADTIDSQLREILYAATLAQVNVVSLNHYVTYLGPSNPEFLLVGDVRHNFSPDFKYPQDPAFLPFKGTSGEYLLDAVFRTPFDRDDFGIINGCDVDHIEDAWIDLGKPRLVALGRNAETRLRALNLPYGAVPHPQFIRRFHHRAAEDYARALVRAAVDQERITWPTSSPAEVADSSTPRSSTPSEGPE